MKLQSRQFPFALVLTALLTLSGAFADIPLDTSMKSLAGGLKAVQSALKTIAASPMAGHQSEWANAKSGAAVMLAAAGDAKTQFPPNVAGDTKAEAAFSAAILDLQTAIQNLLVKAIDQQELNDAQAAVTAILDKKADGHTTFIPHH